MGISLGRSGLDISKRDKMHFIGVGKMRIQDTFDSLLYRLNEVWWILKGWIKLAENGKKKRKRRNFVDRPIEIWIGIKLGIEEALYEKE